MSLKFRKIKAKTMKEGLTEAPSREMWPSFHIGVEHLPEAKKYDIGKTYRVALELEMTGINIQEKEEFSVVNFNIKGIAILPIPTKVKRYLE